jgi:hypothetical protein
LVETRNGTLLVQVWSGQSWHREPGDLISPEEVRCGLDVPPRILRALGVPEADWLAAPPFSQGSVALLALWPLLEWLWSPSAWSLFSTA